VLLARTLKSSTFRLALICIAVFSGTVFAVLGYVYWATTDYVHSQSNRVIAADRVRLLETYERGGRDALASLIAQQISGRGFDAGIYLLVDPSMAFLAGNLRTWPAVRGINGWTEFEAADATGPVVLRASYETLPDGGHLLVGRSLDDLETFVATIRTALISAGLLTFILAAVAGVSVARRTVGRIEAINATTREIMRSGLASRIPLRGTRDEWDHLAENLNAMLDRIEALMREVAQVSDNVAHDLRTPLTRLRARLEKAYQDELDVARHQAVIADARRELDEVLSTFASLLRISRIEALEPVDSFRIIDLSHVAAEVAELFDAAAEEKGGHVKFESAGRVPVAGDRDLLFDAIANLLDNAIKHGGVGDVHVTVANIDQCPTISVTDHGPGIPVEEREHVFKRFYRIERSRSSPGNGLGLSLVAVVARVHRADVELEDNSPGLKVRLRFPSADLSS
jgi:signal transduction histidine kinase